MACYPNPCERVCACAKFYMFDFLPQSQFRARSQHPSWGLCLTLYNHPPPSPGSTALSPLLSFSLSAWTAPHVPGTLCSARHCAGVLPGPVPAPCFLLVAAEQSSMARQTPTEEASTKSVVDTRGQASVWVQSHLCGYMRGAVTGQSPLTALLWQLHV